MLDQVGIEVGMSPMPQAAGIGGEVGGVGTPYFWTVARGRPPVSGAHVAFAAPDRDAVDASHAAALAAGGTGNGAPGLRGGFGGLSDGLAPSLNMMRAACVQLSS